MDIIEVAKNKEQILKHDNVIICSICSEQFFAPFDKLYISVKGACYTCDSDEILSENIFKLL